MSKKVKDNSFFVKTVQTGEETDISLFMTQKEAVMSFESMEEAMTQDMSIAEFTYDRNPKKDEAAWTITVLSWTEIAKARLEAKK
jgi:hypothetical protein